jgi:Fe-S oxidoreductase
VLNLKLEKDAKAMRAIAEEAFALVKEYKGSHSGEHGDGLVRSEFHGHMYGAKTVRLFEEVKDRFDPTGVLNPGKIVRASRMDDRWLFRFKPDYRVPEMEVALDWSAYPGQGRGFQGAVEMCNNNGECRKLAGGVMCPSFRITGNERDVTRGRANALRLAISGQLGPGALASDDMLDAMKLCVSCKACRRECPTGIDMAKMKIEVLAAANARRGLSLRERLVAYLPRYAPYAAIAAPLLNARDSVPGAARVSEWLTGMSARRPLPRWRRDRFRAPSFIAHGEGVREVALLADTFNTAFEPDTLRDATVLLASLGYAVTVLAPSDNNKRALCCGRTFLSAGMVAQARTELSRLIAAAAPLAARGVAIVGLEPSCLFTLRDELLSILPGPESAAVAERAVLLEEFLAAEARAGAISGPIARSSDTVLLHGHCHQKAFGAMPAIEQALALVEGLKVKTVESSCCGMAGAFGYAAETYEASMAMGELSLLSAVRKEAPQTWIAADGFSCRHQIEHGTGRQAKHVASILRAAAFPERAGASPS